MEMNMAKFSEKLAELIELAKKKKNVLEYQEINDFFKDFPLDAEHMDKVFDYLEANGVDVLRIQDNDMDDLYNHVLTTLENAYDALCQTRDGYTVATNMRKSVIDDYEEE